MGPADFVLQDLRVRCRNIHGYFKRKSVGKSSNYVVSHAIEGVSRDLWNFFRPTPVWDMIIAKLAEELKSTASELQIGPPRELYYTMPTPRFLHS